LIEAQDAQFPETLVEEAAFVKHQLATMTLSRVVVLPLKSMR